MKAILPWDDIKKLISFIKPRLFTYLTGLFGSSLVSAATLIFMAFTLKYLVDAAVDMNTGFLLNAVLLTLLNAVIQCLITPVLEYMFKGSIRKTMADIRIKVFTHLAGLRISYFEKTHSGELISRMSTDMQALEQSYSDQSRMVVTNIMYGVSSAVFMFILDWRIALAMISLGVVSMIINSRFAAPIRKISDIIQEKTGNLTGRFSDLLSGFLVMKMFHLGPMMLQKFSLVNHSLTTSHMERIQKSMKLEATNYVLMWANFTGVLAVGSIMVINGSSEFGDLVAMVQLLNGVTFMFSQLGSFLSQLQGSLAGARRVFEVLEEPAEPKYYETEPTDMPDAVVSIENVSFGYGDDNKALDHISFKMYPGKVTALVGPSGGGKSTVMKVLLGYYPPESGGIALMGRDISSFRLDEIRSMTAYVPQDTYLFNDSIKENIRYGKLDASEEEIYEAAKMAFAHDFIIEQPEGYDTLTGERGVRLSGGQKQRIAIARAFLKNAPVLFLDEATSALDSESEELIQQALSVLIKGRTVLVIAHRLSTIENADVIHVIENGKVVETGRHQELIENRGLYRKLYELQFAV